MVTPESLPEKPRTGIEPTGYQSGHCKEGEPTSQRDDQSARMTREGAFAVEDFNRAGSNSWARSLISLHAASVI